jgi:hypothetical protein
VVLRTEECRGTHYRTAHAFCLGLSLWARGHSVYYEGEWWEVFCLAEKAHAEAFRDRFGGEHFDPRERGGARQGGWARWNRKV